MGGRAAAVFVSILASACAASTVPAPQPAAHSYDGPLYAIGAAAQHPEAGAAGNVVECGAWGAGGLNSTVPYRDGATADTAEEALEVARSEGIYGGVQQGLTVAKREDDRVLYVLEVEDVVKQAVIVHNGAATEGAGGDGWYVESWANCDYSEFPRSFTDSIGLQIWTDSSGHAIPVPKIQSWRGPEHCDWQSMTFLSLGPATYVRDPLPELSEYFADVFEPHAELPGTAVETGYQHDGQQLWLAEDGRLAYVGTRSDVEIWPRTTKPLGCD